VQRDAVRALVDRVRDLPRGGKARGEDERRHERGVPRAEAIEPQLLTEPLRQEACSPLAMDRARGQLVKAVHPQSQERTVMTEASEVADDLERELIGPLQVIESEESRTIDRVRDLLGDLPDQDPAGGKRVVALGATQREQLRAKVAEIVLIHPPGEVIQRSQRHEAVLGREVALRVTEAREDRLANDGLEQPGLADPGLPGQQDQSGAPCLRLRDPPLAEREHVVPADKERALERASGLHVCPSLWLAATVASVERPIDPPLDWLVQRAACADVTSRRGGIGPAAHGN
jgi:hypothetical protein